MQGCGFGPDDTLIQSVERRALSQPGVAGAIAVCIPRSLRRNLQGVHEEPREKLVLFIESEPGASLNLDEIGLAVGSSQRPLMFSREGLPSPAGDIERWELMRIALGLTESDAF